MKHIDEGREGGREGKGKERRRGGKGRKGKEEGRGGKIYCFLLFRHFPREDQ